MGTECALTSVFVEQKQYEELLAEIDDLTVRFQRNRKERNLQTSLNKSYSYDEIMRLWVTDEDGLGLANQLADKMKKLHEHNWEVRESYG